MKKPIRILTIAVFTALIFLVTGTFSGNDLTKAQQTSGIVTIAFDDGWNSQFENAFPLMQEHGFVGTYNIYTGSIGTDHHMNMSDLHALQDTGNEIASHGVNHSDFTTLTDAQINYKCNASRQLLQANGFPAVNFVYPYGQSNSHTDSIVLQYYRSAGGSIRGGYLIPIPPTAIQMSLPSRFPGETGYSGALERDEAVVKQAQETNSWVIVFFHHILSTPPTNAYGIEKSDFAAFLNYVGNSSVQVLTVNQVLDLFPTSPRVTILPSLASINVGQVQEFTATPSGGSWPPSSYQWYVNGIAQSDQTTSTFSFAPRSSGSHLITATVTDSLGSTSSQSSPVTVTVNAAPTLAVSPTMWTMDVGQSETFSANPTGGSRSYSSYEWCVNGVAQSDQTTSAFSFAPVSAGSYSIIVTVTDSLGATSAQSSAAPVTVNVAPTVSVSPVGPVSMDVGLVQAFTANPSGGSGVIHFQWYLDGSAVGTDNSVYSYNASGTSHSVTCRVTDSASLPVTSPGSNAVSVRVNSALAAPAVTPAPGTVDHGQTSSLTSSPVTTGTSPYTYQWFESSPSGSYFAADSNSASFSFNTSKDTVTGSWSFILQVADNAGAAVNSSAVSVMVNPIISVSAGAGGAISPAGSVHVNHGDNKTFTIKANLGYYIVDVTVNGSSVGAVSSHTLHNVQDTYIISATFAHVLTSLYVIAPTVVIVAIVAVVLVLRKSKRGKSGQETPAT